MQTQLLHTKSTFEKMCEAGWEMKQADEKRMKEEGKRWTARRKLLLRAYNKIKKDCRGGQVLSMETLRGESRTHMFFRILFQPQGGKECFIASAKFDKIKSKIRYGSVILSNEIGDMQLS